MTQHYSRERLAAYIAVNQTISSLASEERMTIGEIVDLSVDATELACQKGRLSTQIQAFEMDWDGEV